MTLTTRAIVLERLGLADDSISRAGIVFEMDADAHTAATFAKAGSTQVTVTVDGGAVNTYLLATYTTIATLCTAINNAALGVTATAADDEAGGVASTLLDNTNVTLATTDPAEILTYTSAYATGNSTLIDRLVTEVDAAIGRYCNRIDATTGAQTFESAARDEKYDGNCEAILSLRNYPVTTMTQIGIVDTEGTETALTSTDYIVDTRAGRVRWNGSSSNAYAWWDRPVGAPMYTSNAYGWPEGFQNIRVQYTAGYASVPADLRGVATQMCVDLYLNRKQNHELASSGIGDRSANYRSADDLVKLHAATLAPYTRIAL